MHRANRITMARLAVILAVLMGLPSPSPGQDDAALQASDPGPTPLDQLVAEAAAQYPAILAEWAEVDELRAREDQVSQPFDPVVSVGLLNMPVDSFAFDEHPMTGVQIGLSERFYWPGALDARSEEARAMAEARAAAVPETVVRLWMSAVEPYYTIVQLDRALRVLQARRDVLSALRDAARARYEARAVPLSDVLRVETELSRVDQDIAAVVRNRRIASANLNGLLDRPTIAPVTTDPAEDPSRPDGDPESWLVRALEDRPAFATFAAQHRLVEAQQRAAEADDNPVWSAGLAYALRFQDGATGTDLVTLTLGISLPFFSANRTDARLDELSARSLEIDFDRDELIRQLRAQIGTHFEAMDSLEEEIAILDRELIPSVEGTYESALAHYASSHASIETLIEIQDRLLELDLARTQLVSFHDMHRAQLRALAVDSETIREIVRSAP